MAGVPMVATSPMRHDVSAVSPNGHPIHPVDVHPYEPPWKALCDFALHSDLERPGYNHLVNEVKNHDALNSMHARFPPFFAIPDPCGVCSRATPAGRLVDFSQQTIPNCRNKNREECIGTTRWQLGKVSGLLVVWQQQQLFFSLKRRLVPYSSSFSSPNSIALVVKDSFGSPKVKCCDSFRKLLKQLSLLVCTQ